MFAAAAISASYSLRRFWSTWTSGGTSAGAATNSYNHPLVSLPTFADFANFFHRRSKGRGTHQGGVANKLACQPEERLLKVVVGLGRDVVVLQVLLAVERDGLGLDLALLHVDLVAAEDNGNVFANADQIACATHPHKSASACGAILA